MSDRIALIMAVLLVLVGFYLLATGARGLAMVVLVVGTGLGGSAASLPPWARVAFFLTLLLAALFVLILAL